MTWPLATSGREPHLPLEGRPTIDESIQWFCERRLMSATYRPETQASYRRAVNDFRHVCADIIYVDELTIACVRRYDQDLQRRQLGASSRHIKIAAVKAFITYLEEQGTLSPSIAHEISVPAQRRTPPARPVDMDDAAALMRAVREAGNPRDSALVALLLRTGISPTELTELTVADLDLPSDDIATQPVHRSTRWGRLRLRGRPSSYEQEVTLDGITQQALTAYLAIRPASPLPQLFLSTRGTPLDVPRVGHIVKRYARAAGIAWAHARSLRSGFVLRQLATGAPLSAVQRQVGHRRTSSTRRYVGLLATSPRATALQSRTCGVLIVHKQRPVRKQLRSLLESAKHQVFEALDVDNARDMVRLSRLSLVVLLSLDPSLQGSAELLGDLLAEDSLGAEHRVIALMEGGASASKEVIGSLIAHEIPIVLHPVDLNVLLIHLARAYANFGAQN